MIQLLLTYKYLILIPLAIIEGPIVAVIVGFFTTMHIFNFILSYVILVLGDIIGDGLIYYIGYSGKRLLKYFRVTDEKLEKAKEEIELVKAQAERYKEELEKLKETKN